MKYQTNPNNSSCSCVFLFLIINLTLGAYLFAYSLESLIGKHIPWYGNVIGGLILGELSIPVGVICWILRLSGIAVPFFHVV